MKKSEKFLADFAELYVPLIKTAIREQLYLKSPLRNVFQIRPIDMEKIPVFGNEKMVYAINEKIIVNKITEEKIPEKKCSFFEVSCNVEFPVEIFSGINQPEMIIKMILNKIGILEEEKKLFKKLKKHLKNGKGICAIRVDTQVVISKPPSKEQKIGFSIFEQIALFILHVNKPVVMCDCCGKQPVTRNVCMDCYIY